MINRFIRHPVNIPIEVKALDKKDHKVHQTLNLSIRGLAFLCEQQFVRGDIIEITIPFVRPSFEANARVMWCKPEVERYILGVEFLSEEDTFLARMIEQICQIENYKNSVCNNQGRLLSHEEAAQEWVSKFASDFPGASGQN